ncbi:MAG: right-handed parallel beta-helix repeat-containing protein, partial [Armatimonadota bacterium]|nr:right-handed parallel beta-helix repeat-containing protein [Armatimonadota bacterium]
MLNTPHPAMELYVSPEGNDAWSGRLPAPNPARTDGPLKSIAGARDRLRVLTGRRLAKYGTPVTAAVPGPVSVWVRGGIYPTFEPIRFGPEDSFPATYAAYPGETPVIEGGVRITEWQETVVNGRRAWVAALPEVAAGTWEFRQLFVNGRRAPRPRWPKQGLFRMEHVPGLTLPAGWGEGGYTQFVAAEGDVQPFRNLSDVEVVYVHFWVGERSPIARYDPATRVVTMVRPSRAPLVGSHGSQLADYYLDNVFEALTEPGEWYLDRTAGKLYYLPKEGEDPATTEVWAPKALQLLALIGEPEKGRYVEFLRFQGLTFRHTDWRYPAADGAAIVGCSDGQHQGPSRRHARGNRASAGQGESDIPGVITLEGARFCAIEECTLRHLGWYGVEIGDACHGIRVVGNVISDLGAGGVMI